MTTSPRGMGTEISHCCHEFSATILIGDVDHECCGFAVKNKKAGYHQGCRVNLKKSLWLIIMATTLLNQSIYINDVGNDPHAYITSPRLLCKPPLERRRDE